MRAHSFQYTVGGALRRDAPSYVARQADLDLLEALQSGDYCYIFNSRQMGKSSLRVRATQQLRQEGILCVVQEVSAIAGVGITSSEWYLGLIRSFKSSLGLRDFKPLPWWQAREGLSPVQRFNEFLDTVLLPAIQEQPLVIFLDEIDYLFAFDFNDDFFALIRDCYQRRAENEAYEKLSFVLLGVATPSDLIRDKRRTSFNIGGTLIDLQGFQLAEIKPLASGLTHKAKDLQAVLKEVLHWTGGQPFLTQRVCQLIGESTSPIAAGSETERVAQLVNTHIIDNWEAQDALSHLKTIRDRILSNQQHTGKLLGLAQRILLTQTEQAGSVAADGSPEQMELRLSGLVCDRQGLLAFYNPIYQAVFGQQWLAEQLDQLRPYAHDITAWLASNKADESRLLRGQSLESAQAWARDKRLDDQDYQFLAASQDLEKREVQKRLEVEAEAKEVLSAANQVAKGKIQQANQRLRWGTVGLASMLTLAAFTGFKAVQALQFQKKALGETSLALANTSKLRSQNNQPLAALVSATQALQIVQQENLTAPDIALPVIGALQQAVYQDALFNASKAYGFRERNALVTNDASVRDVTFSPDGETIAIASDATVKLWDRHGQLLATLEGHHQTVQSVAFSPDGKTIASTSLDTDVKLWNLNGELLNTFTDHNSQVWSVAFSPDGKAIASSDTEGTIILRPLDGSQSSRLKAPNDEDTEPSQKKESPRRLKPGELDKQTIFETTGDRISRESYRSDETYSINDPVRNGFLNIDGGHIKSIAFSPEGTMLASAGVDGVQLWDLEGNLLKTIKDGPLGNESVAFSPDGKTIVADSADNTITLWDLEGNGLTTLAGHNSYVLSVAFSPDGSTVVSASADNTIKLWDLEGNELNTLGSHRDQVHSLAFSPDGNTLASASEDGTVKLWASANDVVTTLTGHQGKYFAAAFSVEFSPDSNTLASIGSDGNIKLWSPEGSLLNTIEAHEPRVGIEINGNVTFSPDGSRLASTKPYDSIKIWDLQGTLLTTLEGHPSGANNVGFSPDGSTLTSSGRDGTIKVWDVQENAKGTVLKTHEVSGLRDIHHVTFSPDGTLLASASDDGNLELWDDLSLLKTLEVEGDSYPILDVAFSPDGNTLAAGNANSTVKLWNIQGNLLATLKDHLSIVRSVAFSPDGNLLASASDNGIVKLWTLEGDLLASFPGQRSGVVDVAFSPDGNFLATAGGDGLEGTIQLWEREPEALMTWSCHWIKDYLLHNPEGQVAASEGACEGY